MSHGMDTLIGEKGLCIRVKNNGSLWRRAFLRGCWEALLLRWFPFGGGCGDWTDILTRFKERKRHRWPSLFPIACRLFIRPDWIIVLDRGQIVAEGRAWWFISSRGAGNEQHQRQQNRKENKMKVFKTVISGITLYPTVFLAGFIDPLTSHHFSELSCLLLQKMIDGPLTALWPTVADKGDCFQMGGILSLVLSLGQLISYMGIGSYCMEVIEVTR